MSAPTLIEERPVAREGVALPATGPDAGATGSRRRRALPLVAMAGGLASLVLAALVFTGARHPAPPTATGPSAITLSARDVSVVTQVYEPGEDSGWHAHPGIHAVAVLSGTLTVYDNRCQAQTFEAGRPYVGGQEPHLVRNEGGEPVTMAVTYLSPSVPTGTAEHMAPPAGCVLR